MQRGFWSTLLLAVSSGAVAALVTLPFVSDGGEETAPVEVPGLVQAPIMPPPPAVEPAPEPTPEPVGVRRRTSRSSVPAPAPAPAPPPQDPNTIDDLPDGPFGSAKDAVKQSQEQPNQPQGQ